MKNINCLWNVEFLELNARETRSWLVQLKASELRKHNWERFVGQNTIFDLMIYKQWCQRTGHRPCSRIAFVESVSFHAKRDFRERLPRFFGLNRTAMFVSIRLMSFQNADSRNCFIYQFVVRFVAISLTSLTSSYSWNFPLCIFNRSQSSLLQVCQLSSFLELFQVFLIFTL